MQRHKRLLDGAPQKRVADRPGHGQIDVPPQQLRQCCAKAEEIAQCRRRKGRLELHQEIDIRLFGEILTPRGRAEQVQPPDMITPAQIANFTTMGGNGRIDRHGSLERARCRRL